MKPAVSPSQWGASGSRCWVTPGMCPRLLPLQKGAARDTSSLPAGEVASWHVSLTSLENGVISQAHHMTLPACPVGMCLLCHRCTVCNACKALVMAAAATSQLADTTAEDGGAPWALCWVRVTWMMGAGAARSPPGATPVVKETLSVWLGAAQVTRGKPDGYSTRGAAVAAGGNLRQV